MNKFITLALFAICATMANGQIIANYPYNNVLSNLLSQQSGGASSSSSAAASSSASSNTANNGLIQSSVPNTLVSPLAPYATIAGPSYVNAGPYLNAGPLINAPLIAQQGYLSPVVGPWMQPGYQTIGPVGPCGQGILY